MDIEQIQKEKKILQDKIEELNEKLQLKLIEKLQLKLIEDLQKISYDYFSKRGLCK
jgi:hypothetical protein